jgi:hypothetical protein
VLVADVGAGFALCSNASLVGQFAESLKPSFRIQSQQTGFSRHL